MSTAYPHQDKLELYKQIISAVPDVECKGLNNPYTSLNGHMFSFLTKTGGLALRLPKVERDKFMDKFNTQNTEQYGTIMKEYVDVPDSLFKKTSEVQKYFIISFEYVSSLKPRPAKKSK